MTETFTVKEFEAALPADRDTGAKLWEPVDHGSEYTYAIPVRPDEESDALAVILVQSSIRRGLAQCDGAGENSIRAWLVDAHDFGKPLAAKVVRWTARTKNWRDNLKHQLRELWKLGLIIGPCPKCGRTTVVRTVKKEGKNKGRQFTGCGDRDCGFFGVWVDEVVK